MIKRPFLVFMAVMGLLIGGLISYIQSASFASLAKSAFARYVPKDLGIDGDFSEFKVKMLPPGISIVKPRLKLLEHNVIGLTPGTSVTAERIDLAFRPVQMFSRNIRVHEVTIVGGDVNLLLGDALSPKKKKKTSKGEFHWDELLQVHAEAVSLIDTRIHLEASSPELSVDFLADQARVGQWSGEGGLGYEFELDLNQIRGSFLKGLPLPASIDRLSATVHLNASGLLAERFEVALPGGQASLSGQLRGSLLDPKSALPFTAQLSVHGEVATLLEAAIHNRKSRPDAGGEVDFAGKLSGSIARGAESVLDGILAGLKVEGKLSVKNAKFAQWQADAVKAEVAWQASPKGGELSVVQASITAQEMERSGGFQAGKGGRIEIGAFKADLGALLSGSQEPASVTVPLKLERAHLHWLGAGALKQIYPLDLRATGPVTATFRAGSGAKSWQLETQAKLEVERFKLDNQHLGVTKPLHKILEVPLIHVEAGASVDRSGVKLTHALVSSGSQTSFQGSGKIDFKTGLDLFFSGSTDLKDVGRLAENEIRGTGDLEVHVHGPTSAIVVDFDPELKDAYYLHMHLGDLKGRITWDDDPNHLIFSRIQATRGRTTYDAEGMIDLDKDKDTVDLGVRVPIGDIQDMVHIFDEMTDDLWWFPRDLTGPMHGDIRVSGGLSLNRLTVAARINGTDWQQWGERFATVQLQGGYDRGKYQVTDFAGVKRTGRVFGRISFDPERVIDWGFHTENFTIADLDHIAQLDVPMRGKLSVESSGRGKEGSIKSSTVVRVDSFAVRGAPLPPSDLSIQTENGKAEARGNALGGQGTLEALYDFKPGGKSSIRGELKHLDFTPAILMINPKLIQDRALVGDVSGSINLSFLSGQIERASGGVAFSEYHLFKTGARFELSRPVAFKVTEGTFDISDLSLKGLEGEANLSLHGNHSELEGSITGEVDTAIVGFVTPTIAGADGTAVLDFSIGGRLKQPTIFGKATFDGVTVKVAAIDSPFENCSGSMQLRQNVVSIQNIQADLAGGRVSADGTVQLFADRYPQIDIKGELTGNKLKVFPFQFAKVRGGIQVHGDKLPYLVDGDINVDSALSTEKVLSQAKGEGLKALQYTPPPSRTTASDYPKFKLNIKVAAESGVMIRNDLFDAEAKGNFTVVNTLEAPRILGNAEIIAGKMNFKDRSFQIQSANAIFDNPAVINPGFTLTANSDINGTKIQMYASGKLNNWKVELSSNPVMPESEILSLLATGMTSTDAKKLSSSDRSAMEQGEAASLLLNSLDFNRDMQSKTGLQIGLDESTAPQQAGTSVFKPQTGTDSIAQPKIVIRRKIGSRFELSYGQTVSNSTTSNAKEVTGEYHVTSGFSLLGVWDNYETIDAQERTSFGGDLKFQTRFK